MDPVTVAKLWMLVKPFKRLKERRQAKREAKQAEAAATAVEGQFQYEDEPMGDAIKGAAKSKLVWLGVAQMVYGIFQLWATGMLSVESVGPVVGGALTVILRAVTTQSLAEKAK